VKILDLHGNDHASVEQEVHSFVYNNELPVKIITGKSPTMRQLVIDTITQLGYYSHYERFVNEGSLIITEEDI